MDVVRNIDLESQVSYLSSEVGFVTTTSTWTEPEILIFLCVAGNIQEIKREENNGYEELCYYMPKSFFHKLIGRRPSLTEVNKIFKSLVSRNIYFRDESLELNMRYNIFNTVSWTDDLNTIKLHVTPRAMTRFKKLSHYIPFALSHRSYLKRANHIRLYILMKRDIHYYSKFGKAKSFSIDELRLFFGCENKYPRTRDFIKKVIEKSVLTINEQAKLGNLDIEVSYSTELKSGSKRGNIENVLFEAKKTTNYVNYILPASLEKHTDKTDSAVDLPKNLSDCLNNLSISQQVQKSQVAKYGLEAVKNAAFITKDAQEANKIHTSTTGFFINTLANNGEHNPVKKLNLELNHKMDALKQFCEHKDGDLKVLIREQRSFEPYILNYRLHETYEELSSLVCTIEGIYETLSMNIQGSRLLMMECDGDIFIKDLLKIAQSNLVSTSISSAIDNYQNYILGSDDGDSDIMKEVASLEIKLHKDELVSL